MRGGAFALALAGLAVLTVSALAQDAAVTPAPVSPQIASALDQLRDAALGDNNGYSIVEDLVTQIGPRRAGSPEEARARDWAQAMLRAEGFSNVHVEPFTLQSWEPVVQTASVIAPGQQPLVIAALGGSPSTPAGGLEAEVVRFLNLDALAAAPDAAVRGKIVFIDEPMARTEDGSGYGAAVRKRARCAPMAQHKGALACLIRSVGTNTDRFAHQGGNARQPDGASLPAAALAPPDADILARLLAHGAGVRVRLNITSVMQEAAPSGNVIAEIRGREKPNEIVLIAAHLDSWTLGQGAIDDGAGVAIITAAAKLINNLPRHPRRTIRILLAGSEEPGGLGGKAYDLAHHGDTHILAGESDLGADLVWRMRTRFGAGAGPYASAMLSALAPLAIISGDNALDEGGTDIAPTTEAGAPTIALNQDASHYFDVHHTANDTMAQIDRTHMRQNIAAWAIVLYLAAETDWDFRTGGMAPAAPPRQR
jgi:hypothetical protein